MALSPELVKEFISVLREVAPSPTVETDDGETIITYHVNDVTALFVKTEKVGLDGIMIAVDEHSIIISSKLELALVGPDDQAVAIGDAELERVATAYLNAKILSLRAFGA